MHEENTRSCFKKGDGFHRNFRVLEHSPCRVLNTFDEYEMQCGMQMTEQALRKRKTKQKNPNPWTVRLSR